MSDDILDVLTGPAVPFDDPPAAQAPVVAEPIVEVEIVQPEPLPVTEDVASPVLDGGLGAPQASEETPSVDVPVSTSTRPTAALAPQGLAPVEATHLDAIRTLYLKECFDLLREPEQMARLRKHLQSINARESLQAFQMMLAILVPHTKPEDNTNRGVQVQIVNTIRRPEAVNAIEVKAS